jgi:thiamine pyrophosphokinase
MLALFRRSHELLFIYVFGERSDTALPKFVTTTQNANFKREVCLRDSGGVVM